MSETTNKFSLEVRQRAVRMVLDHEGNYPSRWSAAVSVAEKIGCAPSTLHEWVKKTEVDHAPVTIFSDRSRRYVCPCVKGNIYDDVANLVLHHSRLQTNSMGVIARCSICQIEF